MKEQGLFHTRGHARSRTTPTRWSSTSAPSSRASPARAGRRIACASRDGQGARSPRRCRAMTAAAAKPKPPALTRRRLASPRAATAAGTAVGRGRRPRRAAGARRPAARLGGDRRHHELHQHLEPVGDAGRRPAGQEGGRDAGCDVKPWVKTSLAPGSKVVTDYLRRGRADALPRAARLQPGRLRLHHLHRQHRPAAAGRSRKAIEERRPGGGRGALRQPQLRGPHQLRRARQLPGLAAAGRRLRAGRPHRHRPPRRAARHGHRRASRSS